MRSLVLDVLPYRSSSRARKLARTLLSTGEVEYVALARAGRYGVEEQSGTYLIDGIQVVHLNNRQIDSRSNLRASLKNLLFSYVPGLFKMWRHARGRPSEVVLINNPVLLPIGLMHKRRFASQLIFAARERPGKIRTKGSLATWFSRVEPAFFKLVRSRIDACLAACESHAADYQGLGLSPVRVVRNVLDRPIRKPDPPPRDFLRLGYVGTLYQGRGLEELIPAVSRLRARGVRVTLEITGMAGQQYAAHIHSLIASEGVADSVTFLGPCAPEEVASRYEVANVGCVLYAPTDEANDSLPNKLFETMASGRCVLAADQPEVAAIVGRHSCGVITELSVDSLTTTLERMSADLEDVGNMGQRGWLACETELNWETEREGLLSLVDIGTKAGQ